MKIIILIIFMLLIYSSLISSNNNKYSSLFISELETDSLQLIAHKLTEAWLKSFIDTTQEAVALSDFKIIKIGHPFLCVDSLSIADRDSSKMSWDKLLKGSSMIISLTYSVKPKIKGWAWRGGNGRWNEETGWIENKSQYAWIRRINNKIEIYEMGTGL